MQAVASLRTGREAVDRIGQGDVDVVVLDIDMPDLDGISALPLLLQKKRDLVVIMVSTLTRRSAEISLRALALGAADYIPKPETAAKRRCRSRSAANSSRKSAPSAAIVPPCGCRPARQRPARRCRRPRRRRCRAVEKTDCRAGNARCPATVAAVFRHSAAGACDRLLDRWTAGAVGRCREDSRRDRPRPGFDHPAYAADLHHGSGRASVARSAGAARTKPSMASRCWPAAFTWRRAAGICGLSAPPAAASRSRSAMIRRSISASPRWTRCLPRRLRSGVRRASRWF